MGASGWQYRAPYAGSVKATHRFVQTQLLSSGDYVWPWEDFNPELVPDALPRPTTLADLDAAKDNELSGTAAPTPCSTPTKSPRTTQWASSGR